MRSFKEFLEQDGTLFLEEDAGDHNDQFGYQLIYPVYADNAKWALNDPRQMYFFQWGVERGLQHGRELHNIDNEQLQGIAFKSLKSVTAPEPGSGFWVHRSDDRPNLEPTNEPDLIPLGVGKDSKNPLVLQWNKPIPGGRYYRQDRRKLPLL